VRTAGIGNASQTPKKENTVAPYTVAGLVARARQDIDNLSPADVERELSASGVVLVDIRESEERVTTGVIPGAIHAPRGMLEFYADSTSPYHRPEFETDRRVILYCASGGRSALGGQTLARLGYERVGHLDGGIKAWLASGHEVDAA
jgi:rhodanese-related sulfurtransferase